MTTDLQGRSATIYQFPARGRFAVNSQRDEGRPTSGLMACSISIEPSSAWYHDEAIRDAESVRKN
jgi:Protein of unknown function (DUF2735)